MAVFFLQKMKQQYGWKYMLGRHVESVCVILDKAPRQSSYNVNLCRLILLSVNRETTMLSDVLLEN